MKKFNFALSDSEAEWLIQNMGEVLPVLTVKIKQGMTTIREPVKFEYGNEDFGRVVLVADNDSHKGSVIEAYTYNEIDGSRRIHLIPISDLEALIKEKRELYNE